MARIAKALATLRAQIDAEAPERDRSNDGWIGDASHQARKSDHNPNSAGVVTALDITHDPAHGIDAGALAETLRASHDARIKYLISNGRIASSKVSPWVWRPYTGSNAHEKHVHISVMGDPALWDDTRPWAITRGVPPPPPAKTAGRQIGIIATVWGGQGDEQPVAYSDVKPGWPNRYGVALPMRFSGTRPRVRVFGSDGFADCEIFDVGPWYPSARGPADPYWTTGERPRAETAAGTNGAGIDLTPAAAELVGINGKGKVDWEFVSADAPPPDPDPPPVVNPDTTTASIGAIIAAALAFTGGHAMALGFATAAVVFLFRHLSMSTGTKPMPNTEQILSIVRILLASGSPIAAWLIAKGFDPGMLVNVITWALGAGGPLISLIWGMFSHTTANQLAVAAAVPGANVTVDMTAPPEAKAAVAATANRSMENRVKFAHSHVRDAA